MCKTLGLISVTANNKEMARVRTLQPSVLDEKKTKQNRPGFCFNMSQVRENPVLVQRRKCKGYPKEYREEPLQIRNLVLSRVNMEAS